MAGFSATNALRLVREGRVSVFMVNGEKCVRPSDLFQPRNEDLTPQPLGDEEWFSGTRASAMIGVSQPTLCKWLRDGKVRGATFKNFAWRVPRSVVIELRNKRLAGVPSNSLFDPSKAAPVATPVASSPVAPVVAPVVAPAPAPSLAPATPVAAPTSPDAVSWALEGVRLGALTIEQAKRLLFTEGK